MAKKSSYFFLLLWLTILFLPSYSSWGLVDIKSNISSFNESNNVIMKLWMKNIKQLIKKSYDKSKFAQGKNPITTKVLRVMCFLRANIIDDIETIYFHIVCRRHSLL